MVLFYEGRIAPQYAGAERGPVEQLTWEPGPEGVGVFGGSGAAVQLMKKVLREWNGVAIMSKEGTTETADQHRASAGSVDFLARRILRVVTERGTAGLR